LGDELKKKPRRGGPSRREFLRTCQGAALGLVPGGIVAPSLETLFSFAETSLPEALQVRPQYRLRRDIEAVLRKVPAGFDEFVSEKYQDQVAAVFSQWSAALRQSPRDVAPLARAMTGDFAGNELSGPQHRLVAETAGIKVWKIGYSSATNRSKENFLADLHIWLSAFSQLLAAEFQVVRIHAEPSGSGLIGIDAAMRFELVGAGNGFHRQQRIGQFRIGGELSAAGAFALRTMQLLEEDRSVAKAPVFADVSAQAFGANASYRAQLVPGVDHWRTVLDGACGIDVYGHNGVSVGDFDGDGRDDIYICQPAGLPNRLFRNHGDGTFEDVTVAAGVGLLENTACALFADIDNDGRQDLIVVRTTGPLLFLNRGNGQFEMKQDAFPFASAPRGTFTGAAMADYDRDGWLDIYFCLYTFYRDTGQYRYPIPYFDAENGPPNFLFRNNRDGTFRDVTEASGLNLNNSRFSFCCAWDDYNNDGWPDLYVVNDFGRKNLYRNNGNGTFTDVASEAGVEDVGAGMSAAWLDFDQDGRDDLYVADMWTAAGLRVSAQENFQEAANGTTRALYQKHAMGNALLRNAGDIFADASGTSRTMMGRWAWMSDAWDFNHDGYPDLYIANGMISGADREELNSFFWRQVVAKSPNTARQSREYELGWQAINELIRAEGTWSGYERNVFYLNHGNGAFTDVSGAVGLDCIEDGRTFALGDFDGDGRLEVLLKNRNGPQLRYFKNFAAELPAAISFRLAGKKSNRDAIGARITLKTPGRQQSRAVQAGSGFLGQHTKEIFFGLGTASEGATLSATIHWPSGLVEELTDLQAGQRVWVEEGEAAIRSETFHASAMPVARELGRTLSRMEVLPKSAETWLLVPVPAPDFSLSRATAGMETLSVRRGSPLLLQFWSESVAGAEQHLRELDRARNKWKQGGLELLVLEMKDSDSASEKTLTRGTREGTPGTLPCTPDVLATYNLFYRQVFDRHRDMSVPISFLIDGSGNVVKIYQGWFAAERFEADAKAIPTTDAARLAKALPFPGLKEPYDFGRNNLSLGLVYFERGYYEQAQAFFQRAVKDDPDSAEPLYGLGSVYLQQNKSQEAKDCFERALQLHANYPGTPANAWINLGILSARAGDLDKAIDLFKRAAQMDPDHAIALQNLGSAYRQKKDWPNAEKALKRAVELTPEDAEANYGLGMVYAQQNDTERAREFLRRSLDVRPDYAPALNNLGIVNIRTGRAEEAIRNFQESVRVAPEYDQGYLNLARVYAIQGEGVKAKAILEELLKKHPGNAQAKQELEQLPN
jgi:tetratricopeptide (TPR) repeat protein